MTAELPEDLRAAMEADAAEAAENAPVEDLTDLGSQALALENEIEDLEVQSTALKKKLEAIMKFKLPQALAVAGIDQFGFDHGNGRASIMLETKVVGTLQNAPDEEAAVSYLEASGLRGAVKSRLTIDFPEGERAKADDLLSDLTEQELPPPSMARSLHPSTLAAFARQKLKDDPTWDFEKVGLVAFPMTKFTKRR